MSHQEPQHSSLNVHELLGVVFKHKWKILICTIAGLIAAGLVTYFHTPLYESRAKLLVRYVVERNIVDPVEGSTRGGSDSLLSTETEILTSGDLALEVAKLIGVQKLQPGIRNASINSAARTISLGLSVLPLKGNVILVSYKNADPELATKVLALLVDRYLAKHLEIHRSSDAMEEIVYGQTQVIKARLRETEEQVKKMKADAEVFSLADSASNLNAELAGTQQQIRAAEAELAEQLARMREIEKPFAGAEARNANPAATGAANAPVPNPPPAPNQAVANPPVGTQGGANAAVANPPVANLGSDAAATGSASVNLPASAARTGDAKAAGTNLGVPAEPTSGEIARYQAVVARLTQLRQADLDVQSKYKPDTQPVRVIRAQIDEMEGQRRDMETRFPGLAATAPAANGQLGFERVRLAGIQARMEALKVRLRDAKEQAKKFSATAPKIAELERQWQMDEKSYRDSVASLEKAKIDQTLNPKNIPNISVVQTPTPALRAITTKDKIALGLAGGGLALGVALAMLGDLVFDRTVKRPLELETRLNIPLLLSIPRIALNGKSGKNQRRLADKSVAGSKENGHSSVGNGHTAVAPWETRHFIRPYSESIRDRLGLYFELNRMTHKPKLVAVTGCSPGAGASTLAGGIAAALSETGDGKVLLVDMNVGQPEVHPFFYGRPASSLTAALQPANPLAAAAENLYLATVTPPGGKGVPLGLKKFYDLMPNLKASDFDYIIFDMPPLGPTSPTLMVASCMDKVLMVVEAEKTNRDAVKRGYEELVSVRANVSVVFNKAHSYGPKWVENENHV